MLFQQISYFLDLIRHDSVINILKLDTMRMLLNETEFVNILCGIFYKNLCLCVYENEQNIIF